MIEELKNIRLKKKCEEKMYWHVNTYNDWYDKQLTIFKKILRMQC